jgi:hypothetical protein
LIDAAAPGNSLGRETAICEPARGGYAPIPAELMGLSVLESKRSKFLSITHELRFDHDVQFYVGQS